MLVASAPLQHLEYTDVSQRTGEETEYVIELFDGAPTIECFLHGSCFDLRTGEPTNLPATEPVPVYPVRVEGEDVYVDTEADGTRPAAAATPGTRCASTGSGG